MSLPTRAGIAAWADQAAAKSGLADMAEKTGRLIGGRASVEITIASGSAAASSGSLFTPIVTVDTEGDAATDTLTNITAPEVEDGEFLLVSMENAARVITITDSAGGAGQLVSRDGNDIVLNAVKQFVLFYGNASGTLQWEEVARFGFDTQAYGSLTVESNATTTTFAGTSTDFSNKSQVTVFDTEGAAVGVTPSATEDHITIADTGVYIIDTHLAFSGGTTDSYSFAFYKNNGATKLGPRVTRKMGAGGDVGAISMKTIIALTAADTVELWVQNEDDTTALTLQDGSFSVISI
jgi:hypothetical protein